jgi:hypothetical protein
VPIRIHVVIIHVTRPGTWLFWTTICTLSICKVTDSIIHNYRDWCCHLYSSCSSVMHHYMIVLAYLGSQHTKVQAAGCTCWFLRPFIWRCETGLMWFCKGSDLIHAHQTLCKSLKSVTETLAMVRQVFRRESICCTWMNGKVQTHWDQKRWQVKRKVKSMLIIIFDIKGTVFILEDYAVNYAYHCNFLSQLHENVLRFNPNFGNKRTG